jgi:hypothetical protein
MLDGVKADPEYDWLRDKGEGTIIHKARFMQWMDLWNKLLVSSPKTNIPPKIKPTVLVGAAACGTTLRLR